MVTSVGLDLFSLQQEVKAYFTANVPWFVTSGGVPDAYSLHYNNDVLDPYLVLRFSDGMPTSGDSTFGGARYDGYYSYVDGLCIGATDDEARELAGLVNRLIIGKKFTNSGEISPIYGGGTFAISLDSQHPLAYIAVTSFRFDYNISDVGAGSVVV